MPDILSQETRRKSAVGAILGRNLVSFAAIRASTLNVTVSELYNRVMYRYYNNQWMLTKEILRFDFGGDERVVYLSDLTSIPDAVMATIKARPVHVLVCLSLPTPEVSIHVLVCLSPYT